MPLSCFPSLPVADSRAVRFVSFVAPKSLLVPVLAGSFAPSFFLDLAIFLRLFPFVENSVDVEVLKFYNLELGNKDI